jgi:hypothetical protein
MLRVASPLHYPELLRCYNLANDKIYAMAEAGEINYNLRYRCWPNNLENALLGHSRAMLCWAACWGATATHKANVTHSPNSVMNDRTVQLVRRFGPTLRVGNGPQNDAR